jgi:hypothetical protein
MGLCSSKKGQVIQVAYIMGVLMVVSLVILVMGHIVKQFYAGVNEAGYNTTTEIQDAQSVYLEGWLSTDFTFLFMTLGLSALLVFTTFMIPTHPIFMVINVFGIFFLVFLGMIMTNLYGAIVAGEDTTLEIEADEHPIMNFVMSYLPFLAAALIFIASIVSYSRGASYAR